MAAKQADSAHVDVDSSHPQALTRRNMRDFNRAERKEEARKKGVPTPATKNSGREYRTSQPSLNREAVHNFAQNYNTEAPAAKADVNEPVLQGTPSGRVVKPYARPKARQMPSPGGKQKLAEEKAERMRTTGLELKVEKGARQEKEQAGNSGKRHKAPENLDREQFGVNTRSPRASTTWSPGKPIIPEVQPTDVASLFPPEFPRFQSVQNVNDIGAYLANASYIVSVGGPPVSDLKYGIILVPLGEERLLFGKQPDNAGTQSPGKGEKETKEQMSPRPQEARQTGLHAVDEDSTQFRRPRFAPREHKTESIASPGIKSPVHNGADKVRVIGKDESYEDNQGLEHVANGNTVDMDGDTQMSEDHVAQDESAKLADIPKKKGQENNTTGPGRARRMSSRQTASKPQGVTKETAGDTKKTPLAAGDVERTRASRSRKPLPGSGIRTNTRS